MRLDVATTTTSLVVSLLTLSSVALAARPKDAILLSELKCLSNPRLCQLAGIKTMRCNNEGSSYTDGYASSSDPYVLRGSCGVEYTLQLTEEGRRRHPDLYKKTKEGIGRGGEVEDGDLVGGGGGGGEGGGNGWDDPPPPYLGQEGVLAKSIVVGLGVGGAGWRPGFWSGLAGGAAAGYMAGSRGQRNNERNYGRGWGNDGGSSWGSGSGSGWGSSGRSSSSGSSGSGARYESTGYGTTSRR
ncbi:hypothetical protein NEMBOFW57_000859 [Staphylotrichum longicolle]|uniref:Store-operated calcium entry-associated regulatory factor n=1 Tax=Staphylotrichum longicolle TaxID=669026 RepID=A0AAD4HXF2_9PEZI|nr:hypothetical protein NEMBOFW57_000859 [Staphylotrichum longicolle]